MNAGANISWHDGIARGFQWGEEIPIGLFWRRTDLPTLEDEEPVLHDGQGPLAFRKLGIPNDEAQARRFGGQPRCVEGDAAELGRALSEVGDGLQAHTEGRRPPVGAFREWEIGN